MLGRLFIRGARFMKLQRIPSLQARFLRANSIVLEQLGLR